MKKCLLSCVLLLLLLADCATVSALQTSGHPQSQSKKFRIDRQEELLQLVKTYTPEKGGEWEAALNERRELRVKLHQKFEEDRQKLSMLKKHLKDENQSKDEVERKMKEWRRSRRNTHPQPRDKKQLVIELRRVLNAKDEAEIKNSLNRMLITIKNRNEEIRKRLSE